MMNAECSHASNVVKALEGLSADLKKFSPLGPIDARVNLVFDVIRFGADEAYDADEHATLERIGVPRALYTKPAAGKPARAAKRAPRKASKAARQ